MDACTGMVFLSCAWTGEAIKADDAITAAKSFIVFSITKLRMVTCTSRGVMRSLWTQKRSGNWCGAQRGQCADQENRAEARKIRKQPKSRRAKPECYVEERRVSTHREPAVLRTHSPHRFDP